MRWALVLVALGCRGDRAPARPPVAAAPPAPAADAAAPIVTVRLPDEAKDDFPHRKAELAPQLVRALTCFPAGDDFEPAIDAYDGHLVLCAQALTRRGVSAFSDRVSYACWNLDGGVMARRTDVGRGFFDCQDGTCTGELTEVTSYDGHTLLVYDDQQQRIAIFERMPDGSRGARAHEFALPADVPTDNLLAWAFVHAGRTIFARDGERTFVLDDDGKLLGSTPGERIDVGDDSHVLVREAEAVAGTWWVAGKPHKRSLARKYSSGPVVLDGKAYALAGTRLYTLDATTLAEKSSRAIPSCP